MATIRVEEAYEERDETINAKGKVTEVEIPYLVFGVGDESVALSQVRMNHKNISGMTLDEVEVVERINGDTWKVKAIYEVDDDDDDDDEDDDEDEYSFSFDTGKCAAETHSVSEGSRARSEAIESTSGNAAK